MIELRFKLTLAAAIYIALIVYLIDSAGLLVVNAARITVVDKQPYSPPNDKQKIYAIQRNRKGRTEIRRTSNSGASWQGHSIKNVPYQEWNCVAANSLSGQYVYGTVEMGGVYRSDDYMETFKLIADSKLPIKSMWSYVSVSATGQYVMASTKYGTFSIQDTTSFLKYSNDFGITWNIILPESNRRQYLATAIVDDSCGITNNRFACGITRFIAVWVIRDKEFPHRVTSTSITTYYFKNVNNDPVKGADGLLTKSNANPAIQQTSDFGEISMYESYGVLAFKTGEVYYIDISAPTNPKIVLMPSNQLPPDRNWTSVFVAGGVSSTKVLYLSSENQVYRMEYNMDSSLNMKFLPEKMGGPYYKPLTDTGSWSGVASTVNGQFVYCSLETELGTTLVKTAEGTKTGPTGHTASPSVNLCPRGVGTPNGTAKNNYLCTPCDYEVGWFNDGKFQECTWCGDMHYGTTLDGFDCKHCPYPWISLHTPINGYGSCHIDRKHIAFDISPLFYAGIITGLAFFYFLPHFFIYNELGVIDLKTGLGLFFYTCLPACSSLCHLCYLIKNPFYNLQLYIVSCLLLGLSASILFTRRLLAEKAYPQMWITELPPWFYEEGFWDWWGAFCKCAFAAMKMIPYILVNFPSSFLIFVFGVVLYDIKVFAIASIRNTFYFYWTGVDDFQAVPWLLLMMVNNFAIDQWNDLSIVSMSMCIASIVVCFYKYAERYFVYKKPLLDTPIKFSLLGNLLIDLDADMARFGTKRAELNRQRKQIEQKGRGGASGRGYGNASSEADVELYDIYEGGVEGASPSRNPNVRRFRGSEVQESMGLLEERVDSMDMKVTEIEHTVVDIITEVKKIKKFIAKKL